MVYSEHNNELFVYVFELKTDKRLLSQCVVDHSVGAWNSLNWFQNIEISDSVNTSFPLNEFFLVGVIKDVLVSEEMNIAHDWVLGNPDVSWSLSKLGEINPVTHTGNGARDGDGLTRLCSVKDLEVKMVPCTELVKVLSTFKDINVTCFTASMCGHGLPPFERWRIVVDVKRVVSIGQCNSFTHFIEY